MIITRKFKRYNRYLFKPNPHLFICIGIEDDKENNDNEDKESEYLPSEDEQHLSHNNELSQKRKSTLSTTISSSSSFDVSKINKNVISICNDENMYVETSNAKSVKQNYCLFCSKLQTQLARHLETVHRNEPDVKKFAILPQKI